MSLAQKFSSIGLNRDYSELDFQSLSPDIQGWGSTNLVFQRAFELVKPSIVFEVGSWKGASLCHMAGIAKTMDLPTEFICIDTWLGSNDTLWINPEFRKSLMLKGGYPTMFRQFIRNIHDQNIQDRVYPLPMTSSAAYHLLKRLGITPDLVYVDAGHEEEEVRTDLNLYYSALRPGGAIFGDDYSAAWPGVVGAVNRFAADNSLLLATGAGKFFMQKPAGTQAAPT
ncbi:MAG: class I SAM-dependent methyltransferase [Pseudorhodoplanes sp.]